MLEVVVPPSGVVGIGSAVKMSNVDSTRHYDRTRSDGVAGRKKEQVHSHHKGGHKERHLSGRSTSSANDSTLQFSRGEKGVSSNTRSHPQAELREGTKHVSNHVHNHTPSRSGERKRKHIEDEEEQDVWTEHKSSSGRIYYYNKRLDKSQWEKPSKGNLKKPKSEVTTPKSSLSQTASHSSSKSHSHTSKRGHVHHGGSHHHSSSERRSAHHVSQRKSDKKSNITNTPTTTHPKSGGLIVTSPPTPISGGLIVSPTGQHHATSSAPQTPTQIVNHSSRHFMHQFNTPESPLINSQVVIRTPYISQMSMDQSTGPSTPLQPVITYGGGSVVGTPVTPGAEGSGLHPLQRALILQNQYSQVYTPTQPPATPPFHMVSHPQSAPMTPINPGVPQYPIQQSIYPETVISQKFQTPMSRLGRWTGNGTGEEVEFPDPNSLKPLPQLPAGDLFSRILADVVWTSQYEGTQKQIDHAHLESLSRTTVDYGYHCGQLARNLLSLECCRIKTVSRTIRLTDLNKLKEAIEKR